MLVGVRSGPVWYGRRGEAWPGTAGLGELWKVRHGRLGEARSGVVVRGTACQGELRLGRNGMARQGAARCVGSWQCLAWFSEAGEVRLGEAG